MTNLTGALGDSNLDRHIVCARIERYELCSVYARDRKSSCLSVADFPMQVSHVKVGDWSGLFPHMEAPEVERMSMISELLDGYRAHRTSVSLCSAFTDVVCACGHMAVVLLRPSSARWRNPPFETAPRSTHLQASGFDMQGGREDQSWRPL